MAIVDNEVGRQGNVLEGFLDTLLLSHVLHDHPLFTSQVVDEVQA
jgi:hypothetical protein